MFLMLLMKKSYFVVSIYKYCVFLSMSFYYVVPTILYISIKVIHSFPSLFYGLVFKSTFICMLFLPTNCCSTFSYFNLIYLLHFHMISVLCDHFLLYLSIMYTVELLNFVVALFLLNSWVLFIHEITSSTSR